MLLTFTRIAFRFTRLLLIWITKDTIRINTLVQIMREGGITLAAEVVADPSLSEVHLYKAEKWRLPSSGRIHLFGLYRSAFSLTNSALWINMPPDPQHRSIKAPSLTQQNKALSGT